MHSLLSGVLGCVFVVATSAQTLGPKPSAVQHVTAAASAAPASIDRSGTVMLQLDVTPHPNIHVYALGAKDFTPVSLMLTPRPGVVSAGKPTYPKAEPVAIAGAEATPAYRTTFRIVQPVTIAAAGHDVQISGVLNYQACDDRVCYPVAALPVTWTVAAR